MARYMLDTDTCSHIMKRSSDALLKRLRKTRVSDVCISVISKAELLYGVEISPRKQQDETALEAFLQYAEVSDFRAASEGSWLVTKDRKDSLGHGRQKLCGLRLRDQQRDVVGLFAGSELLHGFDNAG